MSDSFTIPRTVAHQDPLSMWLPRQEYWSGLPFPPPGNLIDWRRKSLASPTLTGGFFTTDPPGILFLSSKFVTGHDPTSYSNLEDISSINIFIFFFFFLTLTWKGFSPFHEGQELHQIFEKRQMEQSSTPFQKQQTLRSKWCKH